MTVHQEVYDIDAVIVGVNFHTNASYEINKSGQFILSGVECGTFAR